MGILRTNEISGLETPTAVTGSVEFDGTGDYLSIAASTDLIFSNDFNVEMWIYPTTSADPDDGYTANNLFGDYGSGQTSTGMQIGYFKKAIFFYANGNYIISYTDTLNTISVNSWNHIALVRNNSLITLYVNGKSIVSNTNSGSFGVVSSIKYIGIDYPGSGEPYTGYISNLRILKGTALYTSDFTPPVHELQPIGDTVLLCCNSSTSATAEATGKTITVNGNAAASTFSPGLTRDFTYGTQFQGVAKFDTQGYFVPPSGNTQNRYTLGLDEIVTDGLVLYLDAGNPFSYPATGVGTKWTDLSGNNNDGTLNGGVSYTENNRGALVFDGVNDWVNLGSNSNFSFGTGNFTIECWYRRNGSQPDFSSFLCTGTGATTNNWQLGFGGIGASPTSVNRLTFFIGTASNLYLYDTVISPDLQWIYACVTRSGNLVSLYKNGSLISSSTNSSNLTDQELRIGINRASNTYLKGNISNIRLYKGKGLTPQEIQQNFNALKGRYGYT